MSHPFIPVIAQEDYLLSTRGMRGVQVRLTFASGGSIERKYVLLGADDGSGYLTRAFAIGDLVAIHASGYIDALHVPDPKHHEIDLVDFDPIVEVNVQNVRIAK